MKIQWILATSLFLLILASLVSCSPRAPLADTTPTQATMEDNALHGTQAPASFDDEAVESIQSARQDLARRLGMAVDDITVIVVIGEEFSTNAFYCRTVKERIAREDPPAVISGFSILLKAAGGRYEYHASGQTVIFCRALS